MWSTFCLFSCGLATRRAFKVDADPEMSAAVAGSSRGSTSVAGLAGSPKEGLSRLVEMEGTMSDGMDNQTMSGLCEICLVLWHARMPGGC